MDLSFAQDRDFIVSALPTRLAVLLVGVVARQAASPTARMQARLSRVIAARGLLAPIDGAFNAAAFTGMNDTFTEPFQAIFSPSAYSPNHSLNGRPRPDRGWK